MPVSALRRESGKEKGAAWEMTKTCFIQKTSLLPPKIASNDFIAWFSMPASFDKHTRPGFEGCASQPPLPGLLFGVSGLHNWHTQDNFRLWKNYKTTQHNQDFTWLEASTYIQRD